MPNAISVRPAGPQDFPAVVSLEAELFRLHQKHRHDIFNSAYEYSRQEFDELLASPDAIALVAEQSKTPVGLCFGRVNSAIGNPAIKPHRAADLEDLVVAPAFRGQGIASALLQAAKERAKALDAQYIRLRVWHFNPGAISLYRSLGFEPQWSMMEQTL